MGSITELGSANAIYPFILLPRYRILVCQAYLETRRRLVENIQNLQYPPLTSEPITCLAALKLDGLKCRLCGFIVRQTQTMQDHCAKSHQWVNPRGGSRWFEVSQKTKRQKKGKSQAKPASTKPASTKPWATIQSLPPDASVHLRQILEREEGYRDAMNQPRITSNDSGSETFAATSLWLERTQWPSTLPNRQSLRTDYILGQGTLKSDPNFTSPHEDEQRISCIMGALDSVIDGYEDTVRCTSHTLLCWLLSSRLQSRREIPFSLVAERNSELRYRKVKKQFLAFTFRMYRMSSNARQERIWNHRVWDLFDRSKGLWSEMERQSYGGIGETLDAPVSDQSNKDRRDVLEDEEGIHDDRQDEEEDDDDGDDDVEDWDLEDDEDYYDDSGYDSDAVRTNNEPHSEPFIRTFIDGQPGSTLLVYFSGFLLARQYCPQLSAIIYIQRIMLLERALLLRLYPFIGIPQRPRMEQFESLNEIRGKYMVLGSQSPLAELPLSILFHWSSDGERVIDGTIRLTMDEFCKLLEYFITRAEALCDRLMFGFNSDIDFLKVKDDIASSQSDYSFVKHPENGLESAYLELLFRAYTAGKNGLAMNGIWRCKIEEQLAGGLYTALECENGLSTFCGIYVWRSKRLMNRELGRILYLYLEQVGHFECCQQRSQIRLLFYNILTKATLEVWQQVVNVRLYRQLAIAVTKKHVREVHTLFNRYDDCSSDADINRGITYGLDRAYPFRLQPPLLRAYEWASTRWHEFLHQPSKKLSLSSEQAPTTLKSLPACYKRTITDVSLDSRQRGWGTAGSLVEQSPGSMPTLELEDGSGEVLFPLDDEISHATPQLLEENPAWIDRVLRVLDEHQILVCLLCKFAIGPGSKLERIVSFCGSKSLQDPTTVPLLNHQSKPIPELLTLRGYSYRKCEYLTINRKNVLSHCSQLKHRAQQAEHTRASKDGRYAKYWIVEAAKVPGRRQTDAMMDGAPGGDQCSGIGGSRNGNRDGDEANAGGGGGRADDRWDGMLAQYGRALKVEEDEKRRIAQRPGGVDHDDRWVDKAGWAKHF
ncbi:hypothetical protein EDB81DRAFT_901850 [Dactylonectria macrodidyma]|uniref:C2H2-type domain-containing protein n=1 Tax=Dactylonectria macrodidyma TaxID=307937 RepID=A0A9P9EGL3_9HYPO|nr:hypothetical protein EDB81DRAFT_901850 [Dactylonectria macrodidyma]